MDRQRARDIVSLGIAAFFLISWIAINVIVDIAIWNPKYKIENIIFYIMLALVSLVTIIYLFGGLLMKLEKKKCSI